MEGLKKILSEPSSGESERDDKTATHQIVIIEGVVASSSNQAIRATRFLLQRFKLCYKII